MVYTPRNHPGSGVHHLFVKENHHPIGAIVRFHNNSQEFWVSIITCV